MRDPTIIKRMTEHERALIRSVLHPPYMPRIIARDGVWEEEPPPVRRTDEGRKTEEETGGEIAPAGGGVEVSPA